MKQIGRYEIWLNGVRYGHTYSDTDRTLLTREFNKLKKLFPADSWKIMVIYELEPEEVTWGL